MLGWLRSAPNENQLPALVANQHVTKDELDYVNAPDTPAAAFALKAFRTAVFGTPHPTQITAKAPPTEAAPQLQPHQQGGKAKVSTAKSLFGEISSSDLTAAKDICRPLTRKDPLKERTTAEINILPSDGEKGKGKEREWGEGAMDLDKLLSDSDGEESIYRTPIKHPSKLPPGILVTPGFTGAKKKAVSFAASTSDEVKPRPQNRVRSGLPNDFPGKFPSPWTPKTATPKPLDPRVASAKRNLFDVDLGEDNKKTKQPDPILQAKINAHNSVLKETNDIVASIKDEPGADQGDITVNLDFPVSESGKYWKERVEEVETQYEKTLAKAQKWQEVSKIAKTYAKKKDAQCAEMAEKLREYIKENQKLLEDMAELKESQAMMLNRLTHASKQHSHSHRDSEDNRKDVEELRATIIAYENKIEALENLLEEREQEVVQLSMYIEESPDANVDDVVRDLKRQLRKAHMELREMTLVKVDNDSKKLRLITIEKELEAFKSEAARLEHELREARGMGDTSHIAIKNRSLHENRLRLQVERLEQDKINLMAEIREKVSKEANERREMEKKYKNDVRELDGKLDAAQLTAEKREMEYNDLTRRYADMERQLTRRSRELEDALRTLEEMKKNVNALAPTGTPRSSSDSALWQAKQRSAMQELRQAKEESSDLRVRLEETEGALQRKNEEILRLRFRLHGSDVAGSRPTSPMKDVEMDLGERASPPLRHRASRTALSGAALLGNQSKAAAAGYLSSPSRQLQRDAAAHQNSASASPNRFLSRHPTTPGPVFSFPDSASKKQPDTSSGDIFTTPSANATNTSLNFFTKPSPRPAIVPLNFSPDTTTTTTTTTTSKHHLPATHYPRRVTKRASLGLDISNSRRVTGAAGAPGFGVSRRISMGGVRDNLGGGNNSIGVASMRDVSVSLAGGAVVAAGAGPKRSSLGGMDAARRAAAQARLAEKKKAKKMAEAMGV